MPSSCPSRWLKVLQTDGLFGMLLSHVSAIPLPGHCTNLAMLEIHWNNRSAYFFISFWRHFNCETFEPFVRCFRGPGVTRLADTRVLTCNPSALFHRGAASLWAEQTAWRANRWNGLLQTNPVKVYRKHCRQAHLEPLLSGPWAVSRRNLARFSARNVYRRTSNVSIMWTKCFKFAEEDAKSLILVQ